MDYRDWDRLVAVLALMVPAVGCAEGSIDEAQFTEDLCDGSGLHALMAVEPDEPVDASALRNAEELFGGEGEELNTSILDADGTLCSGASDRPACEQGVADLTFLSEFSSAGQESTTYQSLVFTRGDEIGGAWDLPQLRAFLGEIDSPGDALLLAKLSGHSPVCDAGDDVGERDGGYVVYTTSGSGCGEGDDIEHHVVMVEPDGTMSVIETELIERGDPNCSAGRFPAGLCARAPRRRSASAVGEYLADMARLEAASIVAFEQLALELALHRAPVGLVRAALEARADEVRHARTTARLARRHGAVASRPVVVRQPPRSLLALAVDNAEEGCVRETYGAACAAYGARSAGDSVIRRALRTIARDETRHAALSWSIARWVDTRLGARDRQHVARRGAEALEVLDVELGQGFAPEVHAVCGLPMPGQARALLRGVHRAMLG